VSCWTHGEGYKEHALAKLVVAPVQLSARTVTNGPAPVNAPSSHGAIPELGYPEAL